MLIWIVPCLPWPLVDEQVSGWLGVWFLGVLLAYIISGILFLVLKVDMIAHILWIGEVVGAI